MINEYENLLRTIILEFLGENPSEYKISEDRTEKWKEKKDIEVKKNKGICLENRLIYYSDFYDLKTILNKNWELFLPIFLNKKRFEVFFEELENYRNSVMHGRSLTKSQNLILEGILLDQKNLKTIYHNKNEMKEDYFIRITKVSDNLGNIWDDSMNSNNPILRVGDEYELLIEATDPLDREIIYEVYLLNNLPKTVQKENRFNISITKEFICRSGRILIRVSTPDSEYKNDALLGIDLTVLPK
jgi:hypothetical protein